MESDAFVIQSVDLGVSGIWIWDVGGYIVKNAVEVHIDGVVLVEIGAVGG